MDAFALAFAEEFATLMGLPDDQVETVNVASNGNGGTLVTFEILPPSLGSAQAVSPQMAADNFASKLAAPISSGTFLPAVQRKSFVYTVFDAAGVPVTTGGSDAGGAGLALSLGWIIAIVLGLLALLALILLAVVFRKYHRLSHPPQRASTAFALPSLPAQARAQETLYQQPRPQPGVSIEIPGVVPTAERSVLNPMVTVVAALRTDALPVGDRSRVLEAGPEP